MEKYKQYFIDIFKQAATLFQADLEIDEEAEDYFNFTCNGISYQCVLIPVEEDKVILRTFVNSIKAEVFKDQMLEVYEIMNRFNTYEGGLFKIVALENEGEEYMTIALKSIDVIITKELLENGDVRYYHLNLLADILTYVNVHEIYQAAYFDAIEEYNEFE